MRLCCTHYSFGVVAVAIVSLLACSHGNPDATPRPAVHGVTTEPDELPLGVNLREVVHEGARYAVASIDLRRVAFDLYGQDPEHGAVQTIPALDAWLRARGRRMVLATNSGIYETDGRPLGLHIERGRELQAVNLRSGEGNFYLAPNAVFYVDGAAGSEVAHVVETSRFAADRSTVRLATQSGPALLLDGALHPRFLPESDSLKLRSGVGVSASVPSEVHIAISEGTVNFHDFATLFRDALGCTDALYLDGTVSVLNAPGRRGELHSQGVFGGILVVSEAR